MKTEMRAAVDIGALLRLVREEMRCALSPEDGEPAEFYAAMQYAVGWADEQLRPADIGGGKLFRPRLCLLSCAAAGGDSSIAVPAAAATELLHSFTLVHDDIQDGSLQRHHRPAMWRLIGMPLALNAGDAIYATSHVVLASLARRGVEHALVLQALEQFDLCARRLCEGQHLDISYERRESVSYAEYQAMIERKTGALMGFACYLGALVGGADQSVLEQYRRFGEHIGAGYQIHDDLASVWHEASSTGKRPMEDIYSRKKSYPAVRAFESATGDAAARLREIYAGTSVCDEDALWVRELMTELGLREEGRARVRQCMGAALDALSASDASGPAEAQLREFAEALLS
ncbi:MAG: polyprenyl synthetase family protein [Chloroflexota bacterium]|nr:polyprenyl synthetase family protein [Chloroflexota bacterium]